MAAIRRFELDDLLIRPGTYFNPQTEILVVVDDSPELDREIFDTKEIEGPEWVLISDETPIDESLRDEVLERFQSAHQSGSALGADEEDEDEEDEDDLEPDEEEVDLD
ncbi:MAG TPA: hypothetical protein VGP17_00215 [Solirubrobacteraceae bacterium]|nr:hypothetical protein [Solirubrobacteraceae bacterium]